MGTRDLALVVMKALMTSIDGLEARNSEEFCEQFRELTEAISKTEPKFGILNYHFAKLLLEFRHDIDAGKIGGTKWRHVAKKKINKMKNRIRIK